MTTKRMRSGTYGSAHKKEDTSFAQNCKSLPIPAFVSKTPRHQGLFSIVALYTRPKVWKTTACSQRILIFAYVCMGERVLCFSVVYFLDREMADLIRASFLPVRFFQQACDLCGILTVQGARTLLNVKVPF